MSTDPGQERTLGQLVASATQDISTLVRSEIALAKLEVSGQVKKAGIGGVLLAAAGVVAFYSVYFIFITIAEGIEALGLSRWLSFLIVTVLMLLIAGVLALLGIKKMKTVKPVPKKAISEAQATIATLKSATHSPTPPLAAVSIDGSTRGSIPLGSDATARLDTSAAPAPVNPADATTVIPQAVATPDHSTPDTTRDSSRDA